MPATQGKYIPIPVKPAGRSVNGDVSVNDSRLYRGRPYNTPNLIDQVAIDNFREKNVPAIQEGLRTVAIYMTTGTIMPETP